MTVFNCLLLFFYLIRTTRFSTGLWRVSRSRFSTTDNVTEDRELAPQHFPMPNWINKRLWWVLFGGLQQVLSVTVLWIPVKLLRERSITGKSTRFIIKYDNNSPCLSKDKGRLFFTENQIRRRTTPAKLEATELWNSDSPVIFTGTLACRLSLFQTISFVRISSQIKTVLNTLIWLLNLM